VASKSAIDPFPADEGDSQQEGGRRVLPSWSSAIDEESVGVSSFTLERIVSGSVQADMSSRAANATFTAVR
jgi:hypothetical protein